MAWLNLISRASTPSAWWPGSPEFALPDLSSQAPIKALLVVAHPDDESECAATLYRITHELGGVVDQLIVTNGEGGQNFVAPALDYYGLPDTRDLPKLRRKEVRRAGQIIGIRSHYFLGQRDTGFTLDPAEGFRAWDIPRVRREIAGLIRAEQYDLVVTLLPTEDSHGHHQATAVLVLDAIDQLPESIRPATLGVRTGSASAETGREFEELPGFPTTRTTSAAPVCSFDRRTPLTRNRALDHSIIVHWVIAEHKSQGMFQMEYGRHTHEHYWQFATGGSKWEALRDRLFRPEPALAEAA